MIYKAYKPPAVLSSLVSEFYIFKNYSNDVPTLQRITPDGCYEFNFNFGDPVIRYNTDLSKISLSNSYLTSRFLSSYSVQRTGIVKMVGVKLFPWGVKPFTKLNSADTLDTLLPLDLIFGNSINSLHDELANSNLSDFDAVQKFQSFLISKLPIKYKVDELVIEASNRIKKSHGLINIRTLSEKLGISPRRLEQRFKNTIGISPKAYAKLITFQVSVNLIANKTTSLTEVAITSGYFDQSHFIKDFKRFTGTSPLKYSKESNTYNNLVLAKQLERDLTPLDLNGLILI